MSTPMIIFVIVMSAGISALGWYAREKLRQSRRKETEDALDGKETMTISFGGGKPNAGSVPKKVDPNGARKVYILVFLILIAFFGFRFISERNKSTAISEKCSDITQGTVISVEYKHRYRSSDLTNIVYRYKVGNVVYEIDTTYNTTTYDFTEGGTYPVHYDPDEPKVSYIGETTPQQSRSDFYIILMGVFGLLILGMMLTWKKVPSEGRGDTDG